LFIDKISPGVEPKLNFYGKVTAFLPDENFPAIESGLPFVFPVLGAQVVVQIDACLDDLAAASALYGDPIGAIWGGAGKKIDESLDQFHG
jgi:hypothetical protein